MKFDEWFVAQNGKRELCDKSDQELADDMVRGKIAEREIDRRGLWDERRRVALYAWQVPDEDKK